MSMDKYTAAEIAFQNGYNAGVRGLLHATKITRIVLSVLVAASLILSTVTAISTAKFAAETKTELTEVTANVQTIIAEFRNLAYRIERLEQGR